MSVSSECFYQPRVQSDFDADAESLDQQLDPSNAFQISHADKSFHVFACSSADKANWLANLTKHISRAAESVADSSLQMLTRPVWVPDAVAKECMICQTRFSTFVRKHHCRRCGRVVCSSCSPHHVSLSAFADAAVAVAHSPAEHGKLERVCKECFKEMTTQHNRSNSQSRSLRESNTRSSPTDAGNVMECLPPAQKTNISQHSNHDSTDTEDSDDSSDEKVNQLDFDEQSKVGSSFDEPTTKASAPTLAQTETTSMMEQKTRAIEVTGSLRQQNVRKDGEETQPTPPPRKKKLEKLLRKQIEESQRLMKKESCTGGLQDNVSADGSVSPPQTDITVTNVSTEERDSLSPPDVAARKARRKYKHSKPQDNDQLEPVEQEQSTQDNERLEQRDNDDQVSREVNESGLQVKEEKRETTDVAVAANKGDTTLISAEEKTEGENNQERSPSTSQKRGRGRRNKFKTANEKTEAATTN